MNLFKLLSKYIAKKHYATEPLPDEAVKYLADVGEHSVALHPVWGSRKGVTHPHVHEHLHGLWPDALLTEYCNPRNWAGNPFEKDAVPEEFYLHEPIGVLKRENRCVGPNRVVQDNLDKHHAWVYDTGHPGFIDFFVESVLRVFRASPELNGFWVDNAGWGEKPWEARSVATRKKRPPLNPRTGKRFTLAEEINDKLAMARALRFAVDREFGPEKLLIPNIAKTIAPVEMDLVRVYRGAMSEGRGWLAPSVQGYYTPEEVRTQFRSIDEVVNVLGLPFFKMSRRTEDDQPRRQIFDYHCSLLVDGPTFYLGYSYGHFNDWDGYQQDWGEPLGRFTFIHEHVAQRYFEKGTIYANFGPKMVTFDGMRIAAYSSDVRPPEAVVPPPVDKSKGSILNRLDEVAIDLLKIRKDIKENL